MAKSKRRNNKTRANASRPMSQQQPMTAPGDPAVHPTTTAPSSSPFQPLNMFFHRSRNSRYSAIPQQPQTPPPTTTTADSYFTTNAANVLIDMGYDSNTTTPTTGTTLNTSSTTNGKPDGLMNIYNSDVDTAGSRRDSIEEDVCFPNADEKNSSGIDFDVLEEFIREEQRTKDPPRRRRLSNMSRKLNGYYGDRLKYPEDHDTSYRITYYSPSEPSSIHARSLSEIPSHGERLVTMMKKGCFWIDILSPTDAEMKALGKIFHIHPLTIEDITMEEPREKCEVFKNYYFICFRSFDQDPYSVSYLQPLDVYIIILKEGVLTFHFRPTPHPYSVRKRIKQLKDYIHVTPDWICYAILDDITDSFAPLIRTIEFEVDSIDELVLILKESEQSDMLRRIGYCRKRMMGLLRLLVSKADVIKTLVKRGETQAMDGGTRPALSSEVALYLGDVQDHIITMLQSLNHYEKISSRSHSNYLAQISIEMTQTNNEINDVLSKLTALGSVLIPMNLVTGLWGMNVQVPGQFQEDLTWFLCIMSSILFFCICSTMLMRYYNIV
ncbi:hypothetical protein O0I10_001645 [Lichtheimia ornata]|uniref:Cora-domain-containing protein n=1 Tax=Lichtheimia ornata TaxID=688661 RepID=A0AAD7VDF6_9FUNG|nr:uncharacterized protein O0I10_001645 [Lichtheimia ornata]KAJ8662681.1 hypothetical protein O0I10_001645 [Lichtheimia ornata]